MDTIALRDFQISAIDNFLSDGHERITILSTPPGGGKTITLVGAIERAVFKTPFANIIILVEGPLSAKYIQRNLSMHLSHKNAPILDRKNFRELKSRIDSDKALESELIILPIHFLKDPDVASAMLSVNWNFVCAEISDASHEANSFIDKITDGNDEVRVLVLASSGQSLESPLSTGNRSFSQPSKLITFSPFINKKESWDVAKFSFEDSEKLFITGLRAIYDSLNNLSLKYEANAVLSLAISTPYSIERLLRKIWVLRNRYVTAYGKADRGEVINTAVKTIQEYMIEEGFSPDKLSDFEFSDKFDNDAYPMFDIRGLLGMLDSLNYSSRINEMKRIIFTHADAKILIFTPYYSSMILINNVLDEEFPERRQFYSRNYCECVNTIVSSEIESYGMIVRFDFYNEGDSHFARVLRNMRAGSHSLYGIAQINPSDWVSQALRSASV